MRADEESICRHSSNPRRQKKKRKEADCNSFSAIIISEFTVSTLDQKTQFVNMVSYGSDLRPWGQPSLYYKLAFPNPLEFSL